MKAFAKGSLYVITDLKAQKGRSHLDVLTEALRGGAAVVQLRDKEASRETLVTLGKALRKVCDRFGAFLIVNDRIDVAMATEADGLHLGQEDLPLQKARRQLGHGKLLGVSTHSLAQAKRALEEGADYIGVGPIFTTPTKPDYPPVGVELVREVRENVKVPFFAIGGITLYNATAVLFAGADSVAVVRAVVGQEDVCGAAKKFKTLLKRWDEHSEKKDE